jgi:hypothetical protein
MIVVITAFGQGTRDILSCIISTCMHCYDAYMHVFFFSIFAGGNIKIVVITAF